MKSDSYAVESNIHFPTDINLSWDSARKTLDVVEKIIEEEPDLLTGFRERKSLRKRIKSLNRKVSNIHSKKGANYQERLKGALEDLLIHHNRLINKVNNSLEECKSSSSLKVAILSMMLEEFKVYLEKFTDQLRRRIIKGEKIPHSEKVFSIFEPEVEWLQKGKQGNKVELGHNVLVTTDQYHFILDYSIMVGKRDNSQPLPLVKRLKLNYRVGYKYKSISFDRGFYSSLSKEGLEKEFSILVMPSKGRPSKSTKEMESGKEYRKLLNRHSAVESNINELENSGVDKVPDKGLEGFKRYVGYGILSYNLKRIGKLVIEAKREAKEKKKAKKRIKKAA